MKLIMLDCDGCINSNIAIRKWLDDHHDPKTDRHVTMNKFRKEFCNSTELVFPEFAKRITEICERTDANIVWSSTWRSIREYRDINDARKMFDRRGLPGNRLIGYTPNLRADDFYIHRSAEIKQFLKTFDQPVERVAVIDDRPDAGTFLPKYCKLFLTDEETGLTEDIKNDIINWLGIRKSIGYFVCTGLTSD